jgi:Flp pilus assembly protein TadG
MQRPRVRRVVGLFLRNATGVSAVEFALVLPVMLVILVGMAELSHAIDNYRKVTLLARTISDLTSQGDTTNPIANATMTDILASSKVVLAPFGTSDLTVVVSTLGVYLSTLNLKPYVCSSIASNATARSTGAAANLTVPAPFQTTGMRYILTEVTMPYKPMLGSALLKFLGGSASYAFSVSMPWPTRGGAAYKSTRTEVILPNGTYCP